MKQIDSAKGQPLVICFKCDGCGKQTRYKTSGADSLTYDEMNEVLAKHKELGKELCKECLIK